MSEYLDRDPIPAPPLPFMVVETEGEIFIRRRDGKPYIPFRALGELECQYRHRCETVCAFMNDAHDYGACEEHRRAKDNQKRASEFDDALEQFGKDVAEIKRLLDAEAETQAQAAERENV